MKFLIILLLVIGTVPVYAQLDVRVPQIENPQECMQSEIRGGKGWVPFSIKMFYDTTKDHTMSVEHKGDTNPVIEQNDNVMIFQSNGEDTYKLATQLKYDSSEKRAIYFEYWSEGNAMHTEIINYNNNSFCRVFLITTTNPPVIPTAEELLGQSAYRALAEMPLIKDAINQNTNALNGALVFLTLAVIVTLLVGFTQAIVYVLRKKTQRKQIRLFDEAIKNSNKVTSNSMMIINKVEKKGDELLKHMSEIMNGRIDEMTNSTNVVMLDLTKVIETLKENQDLKIEAIPKILITEPIEDENQDLKIEAIPKILITEPIEDENQDLKIEAIPKILITEPIEDEKKLARSLKGNDIKDTINVINEMSLEDLTKLYNKLIQIEARTPEEHELMMSAYHELIGRSKK